MSGLFAKDIVVLDVTSRLISAIVGVKKAQSVFGIKSNVEKEHPGYENGAWFDEDETATVVKKVISEAMRSANSRSKRLFIGVPAEFVSVVSKEVSVDFDRQRRVTDEDVDFLLEKGNDFDSAEYEVINTSAVYYSVDEGGKTALDVRGENARSLTACVSYMLADKNFVKMFDSIATSLGFADVRYIATNWAECVTLLDEEQREGEFALIDIGYLSSSVSVAKGEGVLEMKSFSLGGGHICGDIYEMLNVPFDLAQDAKAHVDLNLNYSADAVLVSDDDNVVYAADVSEIVKSRLDMFVDILSDIFKSFGDKTPSYLPVYLTGDGIASMRGAKKYLNEQLGKNIEIITPKLPGFVKPDYSSKIALLIMAESLAKFNFGVFIKSLFNGGKR